MKKTPLKNVSKKTAERNREVQKFSLEGKVCEFCWITPATERHHIYTRSHRPELAAEPLNLLAVCHGCHELVTGREAKCRETLRKFYPERMKDLDALAETIGKENQIRRLA